MPAESGPMCRLGRGHSTSLLPRSGDGFGCRSEKANTLGYSDYSHAKSVQLVDLDVGFEARILVVVTGIQNLVIKIRESSELGENFVQNHLLSETQVVDF